MKFWGPNHRVLSPPNSGQVWLLFIGSWTKTRMLLVYRNLIFSSQVTWSTQTFIWEISKGRREATDWMLPCQEDYVILTDQAYSNLETPYVPMRHVTHETRSSNHRLLPISFCVLVLWIVPGHGWNRRFPKERPRTPTCMIGFEYVGHDDCLFF